MLAEAALPAKTEATRLDQSGCPQRRRQSNTDCEYQHFSYMDAADPTTVAWRLELRSADDQNVIREWM